MSLDEDEVRGFLEILHKEPDGIMARLARTDLPKGIPANRADVKSAIKRLKVLDRVGVPGSYHRSILHLMERLGFRFVEAEGAGHPSRVTLVFDEGSYATRITIDDVDRPEDWPKPS